MENSLFITLILQSYPHLWKTLWITLYFFYLKGCFNMQIDKDELLNQAKELLKDEVTQIAFQTWFSSMEITEMTENNIVLKASSQYGKEMLETRYADLVLNTFKFITNKDWTFSVICDENGKKVEGGEVSSSNNVQD